MALAGAFALAVPGLAPAPTRAAPPDTVILEGRRVEIREHTTVGGLLARAGVASRTGRLLDVHGAVLRADAFPSSVRRNGDATDMTAPVRGGDVVDIEPAADRTEATVTQALPQTGGDNPQFLLTSGTVTIRRGAESGAVESVSASSEGPPTVALTFDDGPSADATLQIVDALRAADVRATFFVVGSMTSRRPDLVRRELDAGMVVGDHTWTHALLKRRPEGGVRAELEHSRIELAKVGVTATVFRPPYGSFDATTLGVASSLGMRTVMWTVDPHDYERPGAGVIVRRVLDAVRPGSIVLLHDGGGDRRQTVEAVRVLIPELKARGYSFATLA